MKSAEALATTFLPSAEQAIATDDEVKGGEQMVYSTGPVFWAKCLDPRAAGVEAVDKPDVRAPSRGIALMPVRRQRDPGPVLLRLPGPRSNRRGRVHLVHEAAVPALGDEHREAVGRASRNRHCGESWRTGLTHGYRSPVKRVG